MKVNNPQFVKRIQDGDPGAFQVVVQKYLGQVFRAALGAGLDPQHAEDVTQATFATFIEKAASFQGRSHIRTWLFGILYNKISETRRQLGRDYQTEDIDDALERRFNVRGGWVRPPQPVDQQLYATEIRALVASCLEKTPTQQRMAFVLREVQDFETEEICKILNVTRTNLGVLLYRVRNRLRECLEAKGVRGKPDAEL